MSKSQTKTEVPFAVPQWPAAAVEIWKLDKIKPYDKNPRTHPDNQIALLAELMTKHGVDQPIVVDERGVILKGHGRRLAAIRAGFEEFPVAIHRGLSETEKRAIRVEDNQVALLSEWNGELLRLEVREIELAGYDMPLIGFPQKELGKLLAETNPAAEIIDPYGDGLVAFAFGDYKGRVAREIYTAFASAVESAKLAGKFSLDNVIRSWLPKKENKKRDR